MAEIIDINLDNVANKDVANAHYADLNNPHEVTKAQVNLGNVDNTSDANKPVSTEQANAIAEKLTTPTGNDTTQYLSGNGTPKNLSAIPLTVGTQPIASGTDGRVFFQSAGKLAQSGNFVWDGSNFSAKTGKIELHGDSEITDKLFGFKFRHHFHIPSAASSANTFPNYFAGFKAGNSLNDTGYANCGIGTGALQNLNGAYNKSSSNLAVGYNSLNNMKYGLRNVALGVASMSATPEGTLISPITGNVAVGHHAYLNGGGNYQIAIGASALGDSTSTSMTDVIAIGQYAMLKCNAQFNIGIGYQNQANNNVGTKNTSIGWNCANNVPTGSAGFTENTMLGYKAGGGNSSLFTGGYNVFLGSSSGESITGGNSNVGVGRSTLSSLTTGSNNVSIGNNSGNIITTGQGNITIGNSVSPSSGTASFELAIATFMRATAINDVTGFIFSLGNNFKVIGNGKVKMSNLPTNTTGLTTGDIWNDGGILKVV